MNRPSHFPFHENGRTYTYWVPTGRITTESGGYVGYGYNLDHARRVVQNFQSACEARERRLAR